LWGFDRVVMRELSLSLSLRLHDGDDLADGISVGQPNTKGGQLILHSSVDSSISSTHILSSLASLPHHYRNMPPVTNQSPEPQHGNREPSMHPSNNRPHPKKNL
jgi:hypothetical protein